MKTSRAKTMKRGSRQGFGKCAGTSMIEVLVTVVILAVSLFGIAALQVFSIRYNHNAYLRTQSTVLANDILDRMRANYNQAETTNTYFKFFGADPGSAPKDCSDVGQDCTPAEITQYDLDEWFTGVTDVLPTADAFITATNPPGRVYTISLRWDNRRSGNDAEAILFSYRAEL